MHKITIIIRWEIKFKRTHVPCDRRPGGGHRGLEVAGHGHSYGPTSEAGTSRRVVILWSARRISCVALAGSFTVSGDQMGTAYCSSHLTACLAQ
ncbi:MAG: hypothetical protein KatS3mg112_1313 [Thermogutta sp.]|nr:MAG: hypothetical protein KatS3mg112_1313 [Thermogutta sp.]